MLDPESWNIRVSAKQARELVAGEVLADLAQSRSDVVVLTADLMYSNRLNEFMERKRERFRNVGIAEQFMVSAAAGLATCGFKPYVATFGSFLALLCCEQIRTDVAYPGLPVRLIGHHSGMTMGFYGTSHHSLEDLGILRTIAGLVIVCPADGAALEAALRSTVDHPGPIYFRVGRGREQRVYHDWRHVHFQLGKANRLADGEDLTIMATGTMVGPAQRAVEKLRAEGIHARLLDMHTIKPLDEEEVLSAAAETRAILTVEEHSIYGGLGGAVAEVLATHGSGVRLVRHGINDEYVLIGPPLALYHHYELDDQGIYKKAIALVASLKAQ